MHGIIFAELQKYVSERLGEKAWPALLQQAKLNGKVYMPVTSYPDAEAMALIQAAMATTGKSTTQILEDFGQFIAPDLLTMYRTLIRPHWKTLDVLEHTEETMHTVVRINNPGAEPPELEILRSSPSQVMITYTSKRKMCALAIGIIRGIAEHFGEHVIVSHARCMLSGAAACEIEVSAASAARASAAP